MTLIRKSIRYKNVTALLILILAAIFLVWKCRYGIANIDESFYLTIPFRLCNGDALFVEEWNLTQMAAVLTTPIIWLYLTLTQRLDGIVLFMRFAYVAIHFVISVCLYFRFRKLSWIGSLCASLAFLLYVPYGIMALSYNSMPIMALVLCAILIGVNDNLSRINLVLAGISFSAAVLCCPYLAAVYFIYAACVFVRSVTPKRFAMFTQLGGTFFSIERFLTITIGVAVSIAIFGGFVFYRSSFKDVCNSIICILENPVHPPVSFLASIKVYIWTIFMSDKINLLVYICLGILIAVIIFDKNRHKRKGIYFAIASMLTFTLMLLYIRYDYINVIMWPINMLGIFVVFLSEKKSNRTLFGNFWILGMLYSICSNWASNQAIFAITSASSVATVGTILMVVSFAEECFESDMKKFPKCIVLIVGIALISAQLSSQVILRYNSVFWEEKGISDQTEYISEGVQSGLYVSKERYAEYLEMYSRVSLLKKYDAASAVFIARDTRYYLYGGYEVGAFSAWLENTNPVVIEQLERYYDLNPQKLPDIGYIEADAYNVDYEAIARRFETLYGYEWFYEADGIVLIKNR